VAQVHRLPLAYDDQTPMGEVISRCTADVDTVETPFSAGMADVAANPVHLATARAGSQTMQHRSMACPSWWGGAIMPFIARTGSIW
jgi:hypothetical protein